MATAEGSWRLKLLIGLIIYITLIYGAYGVFGNIQSSQEFNEDLTNYSYNESAEINSSGTHSGDFEYDDSSGSGQDFIGMITGFASFLTFGSIGNWAVQMLFTLNTTVVVVLVGYLIYTFIRDWIPFVG